MSRGRLGVLLGVACLCGCLSLGVSAQEAPSVVENSPGFKGYQSYMPFENGETVNLGNGGLVVSHPSILHLPQNMGRDLRPVRFYNSKVSEMAYGIGANPIDKPHGILGVGWTLTFGRVFLRVHSRARPGQPGYYDTREEYFYSDESGAEHRLYLSESPYNENFQQPYNGPTTGVYYFTNDGSYLRAKYNGSTWTIYEPDGTTRTAGGSENYSYIPPAVGTGNSNPDSSKYWNNLKDPFAQGWYVTAITDRANNTVSISYRYCDITVNPSSPTQPYPGSINEITDPFTPGASTRKLVFSYYGAGDFRKDLLYRITLAGTYAETYDYTQATFYFLGSGTLYPTLSNVKTPELLETTYTYAQDTGADDTHLQTIGYPTGAKSEYHYQPPADLSPYTDYVETRTLHTRQLDAANVPGSSWGNHLTWKFEWKAGSTYMSRARTIPTVVTDPLGTQEVHFISDPGTVWAGKELIVIRLKPGETFSTASPQAHRIFRMDTYYAHDDSVNSRGDTYSCYDDDGVKIPQGNPRVRKTIAAEYTEGGSTPLWSKTVSVQGWDGFGHYGLTFVTGSPSIAPYATQVSAGTFDLRNSTVSGKYQLDRPVLRYGGGTSTTPFAPSNLITDIDFVDDEINDPAPPPGGIYNASGAFKADLNVYDTSDHGLPVEHQAFKAVKTAFAFAYDTLAVTPTPSYVSGDVDAGFTYTSGNVSRIDTSGGDGGSSYRVNIGYSYGIQNSLYYGTSFSYYEFYRSVSSTTSRIDSQQDANGLPTSYTYDGDGRALTITPPGGENVVRFSYPSATTMGWRTCNAVKKYKGQLASVPSLNRGDTIFGLYDPDLFTITSLDDLGRAWLVDSVDPDNTWVEKATLFDPLGRAVFVSEPYAYGQNRQLYSVSGLPAAGDSFSLTIPVSSADHGYGTWDSIYSTATQPSPFSGTLEAFYRTQWLVKPDSNLVGTEYNVGGYSVPNHRVTVYGIQTSDSGTSDAATTYTKDILGRLLTVNPPAGAGSTNAYDGIGNLYSVTLSGQTARSYTYSALGRLTDATNPESGTVSSMQYDPMGNLIQYTDAAITTFTKDYDFKGRLRHVYKSGVTLSQWTYDQSTGHGSYYKNRLTQTWSQREDGTGWVVEDFTYDQFGGRLGNKKVTFTLGGGITSRIYDLTYRYEANQGLLYTEAAARGTDFSKTITSAYIHGGLKTRRFADLKGVSGITYKPSGMMDVMTYSNASTLGFTEQSDMARLSNIEVKQGGVTTVWSTGTYLYDGAGNIKSIGPGYGLTQADEFRYDVLSRLTTARVNHVNPITSTAFRVDLGYTYDGYGNALTRTITTSDTLLNSYMGTTEAGYFKAETNFSVSCSASTNRITTAGYGYDTNGNLTADTKNTLTYDPLNRLKQASINSTVNSEQYYYDVGGERAAVCRYSSSTLQSVTHYLRTGAQVLAEETFNLVGSPADQVKAYLYVGGNLVCTEKGEIGGGSGPPTVPDGKSATTPLRASKLDSAGNSIYLTFGTTCSAVTHEILYGGGSQLPTSYSGTYNTSGAQCGIGASSPYTWSNSINPAGDAKRFYWFLIVATDGSATEGAWGKNSGSIERTGPGTGGSSGRCSITAKSFTNTCGATLTEDEELIAEVLANEILPEDEPLLANEECWFYAFDHLGTARYVFPDGAGTPERHSFEPFGIEVRPYYNLSYNTHWFTGHERDDATKQHYANFRYIGASIARFTIPDTLAGSGFSPQSMNLYSYVRGNPANLGDPSGHYGSPASGAGTYGASQGLAYKQNLGMFSFDWAISGLVSTGYAICTTTWQTTINYYENNGTVSTSVVATWTSTEMVDLSSGTTVPGSWIAGDAKVTAGLKNTNPRLNDPSAMATITTTVETILNQSENLKEALVMLAIGMRESHLGLTSPSNPTQLSISSGLPVSTNVASNVKNSFVVLRGVLNQYTSLTEAVGHYNGVNPQSYGRMWQLTYRDMLNSLTSSSTYRFWP